MFIGASPLLRSNDAIGVWPGRLEMPLRQPLVFDTSKLQAPSSSFHSIVIVITVIPRQSLYNPTPPPSNLTHVHSTWLPHASSPDTSSTLQLYRDQCLYRHQQSLSSPATTHPQLTEPSLPPSEKWQRNHQQAESITSNRTSHFPFPPPNLCQSSFPSSRPR